MLFMVNEFRSCNALFITRVLYSNFNKTQFPLVEKVEKESVYSDTVCAESISSNRCDEHQ